MQQVLPPGTGLFLSRVIVVTVPLPWPKPALSHPLLAEASKYVASSSIRSRLFAAEPGAETSAGEHCIDVFERSSGQAEHVRWDSVAADEIAAIVQAVSTAPLASLSSLSPAPALVTDQRPALLICTQDSHDICCGHEGVRFADEVEAQGMFNVQRVSHTGGHRFAPTFLSFPDGRMWAYGDAGLLGRIASDSLTGDDYRSKCRGWWGAAVGPAQAAEIAVRAETAGLDSRETLDVKIAGDAVEGRWRFDVASLDADAPSRWQVDVEVGRQVASVACEAPGGLPAKPGREFAWTVRPVAARLSS